MLIKGKSTEAVEMHRVLKQTQMICVRVAEMYVDNGHVGRYEFDANVGNKYWFYFSLTF